MLLARALGGEDGLVDLHEGEALPECSLQSALKCSDGSLLYERELQHFLAQSALCSLPAHSVHVVEALELVGAELQPQFGLDLCSPILHTQADLAPEGLIVHNPG